MADTQELQKLSSTSSSFVEPDIVVDEEREDAEAADETKMANEDAGLADEEEEQHPSELNSVPPRILSVGGSPSSLKLLSGRKGEGVPQVSTERTNIRQRLEMAVKTTPVEENRSSNLIPLTQQFEETRKNLRNLHSAAEEYQQCLRQLHNKRVEMTKHMSKIAEDTPLFDAIGKPKSEDEDGNILPPLSLEARVHLCANDSEAQDKQFEAIFLDYVSEWDRVTSERIIAEVQQAGKLKTVRSHYEGKVNKLRNELHDSEEKGRSMRKSQAEKLERNEKKLAKAYNEHEEFCGHLCVLIEEASTSIGRWRDLLPLARGYMKWESDRCESEMRLLGTLSEVIDMMDADAKEAAGTSIASETMESK